MVADDLARVWIPVGLPGFSGGDKHAIAAARAAVESVLREEFRSPDNGRRP